MLKKRHTWLVRAVALATASFVAFGSGAFGIAGAEPTDGVAEVTTATPEATVAGPISVERTGNVDIVTVDDPEGEAWEWGGKASLEDVFALRYEGKGEIKKVVKIVADGRTLAPELVGFVNGDNGNYVAFSLQALYQVPPQKVVLTVETTKPGEYTIADSKDVPAQADLAASGYVAPNIDEMNSVMESLGFRAASQSNSVRQVRLKDWSSMTRLSGASGGKGPRVRLRVNIGGTNGRTNLYLTELVLRHWDSSSNTRYGLEGPITVKKNGGRNSWDTCTINNPQVNAKRANGTNQEISIDLSSCSTDLAVWEAGTDYLEVEFNGPSSGNPQGDYTVELYANTQPNTMDIGEVKEWDSVLDGDAVKMTASQGDTSIVTIKRTLAKGQEYLSGPVIGKVQSQNGYDLDSSVLEPELVITGPNGREIYRQSGKVDYGQPISPVRETAGGGNGWAGASFAGAENLTVPAGSTIEIKLGFKKKGTVTDSSVQSPVGPGTVTFEGWKKPTGKCGAVVPRKGPRELTADEKAYGTSVYVAYSPSARGTGSRTSTRLARQIQGQENFDDISESRWVYNALSYNQNDNWLYAVSQVHSAATENCPAGRLLQIDPASGDVYNIGEITGGGVFTIAQPWDTDGDRDFLNTGWFQYTEGDSADILWVANSSTSGTRKPYPIYLPSVGSKNPKARYDLGWGGFFRSKVYSEDHATLFGETDQESTELSRYAWGVMSKAGLKERGFSETDIVIERWDSQTQRSRFFKIDNPRTVGGKEIPTGKTWGKAWTYGNGNLGFGTGGEGADNRAIQIEVTDPASDNPTFKIISVIDNAPASYNTDATSNAPLDVPPTDLAIKKVGLNRTDGGDHKDMLETMKQANDDADGTKARYWAVTVTNNSQGVSSGFTVTDKLPSNFDPKRVLTFSEGPDAVDQYNVYYTSADSPAYIEWNSPSLKAGESRNFYLSAPLRPGKQCVPNTVRVVGNEKDDKEENNIDKDHCPGAVIELAKIDAADVDKLGDGVPEKGNLLEGSKFEVQKLVNGKVAETYELEADKDGFQKLKDNAQLDAGNYVIVERQAPQGYQLLLEPLRFNVVEKDGSLVVEPVQAQQTGLVKIMLKGDAYLFVVGNIRQGELPKTGGIGVWTQAAVSLLIIGGGILLARRRA